MSRSGPARCSAEYPRVGGWLALVRRQRCSSLRRHLGPARTATCRSSRGSPASPVHLGYSSTSQEAICCGDHSRASLSSTTPRSRGTASLARFVVCPPPRPLSAHSPLAPAGASPLAQSSRGPAQPLGMRLDSPRPGPSRFPRARPNRCRSSASLYRHTTLLQSAHNLACLSITSITITPRRQSSQLSSALGRQPRSSRPLLFTVDVARSTGCVSGGSRTRPLDYGDDATGSLWAT